MDVSWTVKKAERRRFDAFEPWCRYKDAEVSTAFRCLLEKILQLQFDTGFPHLAEDSQILHNQTDVFDLDD